MEKIGHERSHWKADEEPDHKYSTEEGSRPV